MTQPDKSNIEDLIEYRGTIPLSDRPSDVIGIVVNKTQRTIMLTDVNGAPYVTVVCPAVFAGARPEYLQ